MRIIDLDLWRDLSVQERDEILAEANAKPSLFKLFIMACLKFLEDYDKPKRKLNKKSIRPIDTLVFKSQRKNL